MHWWLHLTIYILTTLVLFFTTGGITIFLYADLIPFLIFFLPIPVVIFHLLWQRIKVRCISEECTGSMRMSSVGSLYYICDSCGKIKQTIIRRNPNDRG